MDVIDSQLHLWEESPPATRTWDEHAFDATVMGAPLTIDRAITAMDAVGVDAAVVDLLPMYRGKMDGFFRFDNSYAEEAALQYPNRFASVGRVDRADPELEDRLAELMSKPGVVGIRVVAHRPEVAQILRDGGFHRLLSAAQAQEVPVWILIQPHLDVLADIAHRYPDLRIVIDHFGLKQPPHDQPDPYPFQQLPEVLALGAFPNCAVKLTAAPSLSAESYPFRDLWPYLHSLIEAFGPDRIMWGSDFTRVRGLVNYADGLGYILHTDELSAGEKALILGATLRRIFKWPASSSTPASGGH